MLDLDDAGYGGPMAVPPALPALVAAARTTATSPAEQSGSDKSGGAAELGVTHRDAALYALVHMHQSVRDANAQLVSV